MASRTRRPPGARPNGDARADEGVGAGETRSGPASDLQKGGPGTERNMHTKGEGRSLAMLLAAGTRRKTSRRTSEHDTGTLVDVGMSMTTWAQLARGDSRRALDGGAYAGAGATCAAAAGAAVSEGGSMSETALNRARPASTPPSAGLLARLERRAAMSWASGGDGSAWR